MHFNIIHVLCFFSALLAGGMASPIAAESSLEPRGFPPPPPIPGCPGHGFNPVTQINQCSSGTPYCCSPSQSGNTCVKADVSCDQTVICCNNNGGVSDQEHVSVFRISILIKFNQKVQLCIGGTNINIDVPITINA
jgi:hypothetical protein